MRPDETVDHKFRLWRSSRRFPASELRSFELLTDFCPSPALTCPRQKQAPRLSFYCALLLKHLQQLLRAHQEDIEANNESFSHSLSGLFCFHYSATAVSLNFFVDILFLVCLCHRGGLLGRRGRRVAGLRSASMSVRTEDDCQLWFHNCNFVSLNKCYTQEKGDLCFRADRWGNSSRSIQTPP